MQNFQCSLSKRFQNLIKKSLGLEASSQDKSWSICTFWQNCQINGHRSRREQNLKETIRRIGNKVKRLILKCWSQFISWVRRTLQINKTNNRIRKRARKLNKGYRRRVRKRRWCKWPHWPDLFDGKSSCFELQTWPHGLDHHKTQSWSNYACSFYDNKLYCCPSNYWADKIPKETSHRSNEKHILKLSSAYHTSRVARWGLKNKNTFVAIHQHLVEMVNRRSKHQLDNCEGIIWPNRAKIQNSIKNNKFSRWRAYILGFGSRIRK